MLKAVNFTKEDVLALGKGKSQFRRVLSDFFIKRQPKTRKGDVFFVREGYQEFSPDEIPAGRYSKSGLGGTSSTRFQVVYRADGPMPDHPEYGGANWMPLVAMSHEQSRFDLVVTHVRIEKLQEISAEDALKEGISVPRCGCEVCSMSSSICPADQSEIILDFKNLWCKRYGEGCWDANPEVEVITFRPLIKSIKYSK